MLLLPLSALSEPPAGPRGLLPRLAMPGESYRGPLPQLTATQRQVAGRMERTVRRLCDEIGPRSLYDYGRLVAAAIYLEQELARHGYAIQRHSLRVRGRDCWNIVVERPGTERGDEIIILGAHYDTIPGVVGANDNASGVAATVALAQAFAERQLPCTLRFALFVNEEAPWFRTPAMGSWHYAEQCQARGDQIVAMYSLETIGYFTQQTSSQRYPPLLSLFYPTRGNFIAFVGNVDSGPLVSRTVGSFREHAQIPSEGVALPAAVSGVGWSDHWSFWQAGYRAVMITDTAPFRYPHYHRPTDTPDKLDYPRMALLVSALEKVVTDLASRATDDLPPGAQATVSPEGDERPVTAP